MTKKTGKKHLMQLLTSNEWAAIKRKKKVFVGAYCLFVCACVCVCMRVCMCVCEIKRLFAVWVVPLVSLPVIALGVTAAVSGLP